MCKHGCILHPQRPRWVRIGCNVAYMREYTTVLHLTCHDVTSPLRRERSMTAAKFPLKQPWAAKRILSAAKAGLAAGCRKVCESCRFCPSLPMTSRCSVHHHFLQPSYCMLWSQIHPFHVLRINKMLSCAGADRLQTGMRGAFGKAQGTAARVNIGQILMSIRCKDNHTDAVRPQRQRLPHCQPTLLLVREVCCTHTNFPSAGLTAASAPRAKPEPLPLLPRQRRPRRPCVVPSSSSPGARRLW